MNNNARSESVPIETVEVRISKPWLNFIMLTQVECPYGSLTLEMNAGQPGKTIVTKREFRPDKGETPLLAVELLETPKKTKVAPLTKSEKSKKESNSLATTYIPPDIETSKVKTPPNTKDFNLELNMILKK